MNAIVQVPELYLDGMKHDMTCYYKIDATKYAQYG